jgi:hypothetical protein
MFLQQGILSSTPYLIFSSTPHLMPEGQKLIRLFPSAHLQLPCRGRLLTTRRQQTAHLTWRWFPLSCKRLFFSYQLNAIPFRHVCLDSKVPFSYKIRASEVSQLPW